MVYKLTAVFVLTASTAIAKCPSGGEVLLSCDIANSTKHLETCLLSDVVTYTFGVKGLPSELSLTRPIREVDHTPWPGIGGWIWEEFALFNASYAYRVSYAFERDPENMTIEGALEVWKGDDVIASMECDPDTVDFSGFPSPVYDAKVAAGQRWISDIKRWIDDN